MYIALREGDADSLDVKSLLDLARDIPVSGPAVFGLDPRPAEQVDGRIGQFIDMDGDNATYLGSAPDDCRHVASTSGARTSCMTGE